MESKAVSMAIAWTPARPDGLAFCSGATVGPRRRSRSVDGRRDRLALTEAHMHDSSLMYGGVEGRHSLLLSDSSFPRLSSSRRALCSAPRRGVDVPPGEVAVLVPVIVSRLVGCPG